ncbi:ABC transporter substrate-binding protein [Halomonas elongata]|uniref:ABC transporter substrate-binding protein n=1 Tax=Halomonas elongata (strain ATCC 33173 / DSM 2581 / NBRC 15536 / NCIMB 2198 / 1H9) TaxID=768066 RepID=E1V7U6_HALED|nr:ABC transporter substrate-binding protein [Halomonas elongata]WBF17278.1 ABC transporter substrate-binding protein [Halomonas elongata]WPU46115.1 ABC transporter substrate-binding protein [Halomonas elongata DSM 2581]CBV43534.1 probable ABC-type transport system periplasmic substrate-binding protein YnjB [Halomonas elongata DSM 2581]
MPRRFALALALALAGAALATSLAADDTSPLNASWSAIERQARGQTVYWSAWGGDPAINRYIGWVAGRMDERHDLEVVHVKVDDIATTISRIVAEQAAGNDAAGAVDLMWINGENFAAMKERDLLFGPFARRLPNFALTSPDDNPEMLTDFTLPTEGYESPWGKAQLTFYHDTERVAEPPRSLSALLSWVREHPGRFTYPLVPNFLGSTFLKQVLLSQVEDPSVLAEPASRHDVEAVTAPLWDYLDALHPHLWRQGRHFPSGGPELKRLMGDGELSLAFTFNPAEPAAAVTAHQLPPSTRSYVLQGGTLGNVHFVAIPFNARHKAGAMLLANFLLSPEAQARKQDIDVWGDPSVLDMRRLDADERQAFEGERHPASPPPEALQRTLPEPHPSWVEALEAQWQARYGNG